MIWVVQALGPVLSDTGNTGSRARLTKIKDMSKTDYRLRLGQKGDTGNTSSGHRPRQRKDTSNTGIRPRQGQRIWITKMDNKDSRPRQRQKEETSNTGYRL